MLTSRIIPCLDVQNGRVVKGVRFSELRDAGVPWDRAALYQQQGADEIVLLDVSATTEARLARLETVRRVRRSLALPLSVGGGVRRVEQARELLENGADKVAVNTAAVRQPALLEHIAGRFGSQCCVLALDAAARPGGGWDVRIASGKESAGRDAIEWAEEAVRRGAGEILLTSWDRDGTRAGYDIPLLAAVRAAVQVPIIASGGADGAAHMAEALEAGADAVLAASIFHDDVLTVTEVKYELQRRGVMVRT